MTFNLSSDMDPFIMPDGRLLFASWQRAGLNRGLPGRIGLFGIGIDGTDYAVFSADEGKRIKHMPCATTSGRAVFVEAETVPWDGAGSLGCVSLRRPLHSYRPVTQDSDGLFHSPSPLPDGGILVSRRSANGRDTHAAAGRTTPRQGPSPSACWAAAGKSGVPCLWDMRSPSDSVPITGSPTSAASRTSVRRLPGRSTTTTASSTGPLRLRHPTAVSRSAPVLPRPSRGHRPAPSCTPALTARRTVAPRGPVEDSDY